MSSYAFWNNKGGVGKSFLCFVAACEYAEKNPDSDIYVIDLCPQANISETLLGGQVSGARSLNKVTAMTPRRTIAGYLEARMSSPFSLLSSIDEYVTKPSSFNKLIPKNIQLICGDNLVEVLADPIRQASQLALPADSWKRVMLWVQDLVNQLRKGSDDRDALFFIDCNPSFSIYTQQALLAADSLVVPFTPDESSRRGVENIAALLYGIMPSHAHSYGRLSFYGKASEQGAALPRLRHFVNNRVTFYEGKPSKAFAAASKGIKETVDGVFDKRKSIFHDTKSKPSEYFFDIPDNHSANVVCALTGTPLSKLKAGPHMIRGERIQVNPEPLTRYKKALSKLVDAL
jgi:cellulose biosynthesis protein BcsQ